MRRNIILMTILFIVIGISGCGGGDGDTSASKWRVGNKGLEMSFQPGSPAKSVFDGDKIDIALDLWNRGAEPLSGDIYLTGFDPSIFQGIITSPGPFSIIDSKTKYNTQGGYVPVRQTGFVVLPPGMDSFSTRINAVACYDYQTVASIPVCIDPAPNRNDNTDPCRPGSFGAGTQAAPVAITNVDVESTPNRAIFRITISNVGSGEVLASDVVPRCMDNIYTADKNWVYFEAFAGNAYALQCEPTNPVKLSGNSGTVTCWLDNPGINGDSAFTTTLNMNVIYGYKDVISTNVEIRSNV